MTSRLAACSGSMEEWDMAFSKKLRKMIVHCKMQLEQLRYNSNLEAPLSSKELRGKIIRHNVLGKAILAAAGESLLVGRR